MASGKDSDRYYINLLSCNDKTTMTIDVVIPERIALDESVRVLGARARRAGEAPDSQKTRALTTIARLVRENQANILAQNQEDLRKSQGLSPSLTERLESIHDLVACSQDTRSYGVETCFYPETYIRVVEGTVAGEGKKKLPYQQCPAQIRFSHR